MSVYRRVLGGRAPLEKSLPFRHRANLVATSKCDDKTRTVQLFLLYFQCCGIGVLDRSFTKSRGREAHFAHLQAQLQAHGFALTANFRDSVAYSHDALASALGCPR
jgi:hypothetical protein